MLALVHVCVCSQMGQTQHLGPHSAWSVAFQRCLAAWLAGQGITPGPNLGWGHLMVFYQEGVLGTPGNSSQEEMQQPRPSVAAGQTPGTSSIHGILG